MEKSFIFYRSFYETIKEIENKDTKAFLYSIVCELSLAGVQRKTIEKLLIPEKIKSKTGKELGIMIPLECYESIKDLPNGKFGKLLKAIFEKNDGRHNK